MKPVAMLLAALLCLTPVAYATQPSTSATSAILIDGETGRVLYEDNAQEERAIASITKLMTALVAVECTTQLDTPIEILPEWTGAEGSSIYLTAGEKLTLRELLYGLLLSSGNDAAVAIACACGGDEETFVGWMNRKAEELGMEHSHFANPNGLDQEGHYSTAYDMALLGQVVMEHEVLSEIVATESISITGRSLTNHNKLLWQYEGCVGMKTGYTDDAGRTLVSGAQRDGQTLIVVTLKDSNDWVDHAVLFDYGFETYPERMLALAGREVATIPVTGSLSRFVGVCTASDVYYPLKEDEGVTVKITMAEEVEAPVTEGAIAGAMIYYLDGEPIGETYLVYESDVASDVAEQGLFSRLLSMFAGGGETTLSQVLRLI